MSDDPYVYPGTDVLRNARGIRDRHELDEFEARLTFLRSLQLGTQPIAGEYDLAHRREIHRFLFAGLYEWAGELRTVVLAKTEFFCLPEHIESYAAEVLGKLAGEGRLHGLGRQSFVSDSSPPMPAIASTGRWLIPQRNTDASVAAMHGDEAPMRRLLDEITQAKPGDKS